MDEKKRERAFSDKISRENRWRWITAASTVCVCMALTYAHLKIVQAGGMIEGQNFWHVFFVQAMILLLSGGVSWAMRDAQRHDLYVEIRRHSLTQLKRFRGEIDDEIQALKEEQTPGEDKKDQAKVEDKKIKQN